MADKKINDLPALVTQVGTDVYEVSNNAATLSSKETRAQMFNYIESNLVGTAINANYTPVNYIAEDSTISGNLSGIDNAIGLTSLVDLEGVYNNGSDANIDLISGRPIIFINGSSSSTSNAVTTASTGTNTVANNRISGWTFTPSINIRVIALQYDVSLATSSQSRETGIYNRSTQELLGSVFISNSDPIDGSGNYYTSILDTPIDLISGTSYVFATVVPANQSNHTGSDAVPHANITITERGQLPSTISPLALTFPQSFTTVSNVVQVGSFEYVVVTNNEEVQINDPTANELMYVAASGRPALISGNDESVIFGPYGVNVSSTRNLATSPSADWFHFFEANDSTSVMTQYGALACKILSNTHGSVAGLMYFGAAVPGDAEVVPFIAANGLNSTLDVFYDINQKYQTNTVGNFGNYDFIAENSSSSLVTYASLSAYINVNTAGNESGALNFNVIKNGSQYTFIGISGNGNTITLNSPVLFNGFLNVNNQNIVNVANFSTGSVVTSAQMALLSTTQGFLPNVMTTAQFSAISSPSTGLMAYDTNKLRYTSWNGSAVKDIAYTTDIVSVPGNSFVPTFTSPGGMSGSPTSVKAFYSATGTTTGSIVTVTLQFTYTASAGSATINVQNPIATTFTTSNQASMTGQSVYASTPNIGDGQAIDAQSQAATNTVVLSWIVAVSVGSKTVNISYTYQIQ